MLCISAEFADKIFKRSKPAELPGGPARHFEIVVNLKTAKDARAYSHRRSCHRSTSWRHEGRTCRLVAQTGPGAMSELSP